MPKNWTLEQQKAIQTKGGEILVSAAAGSGKTAVLVERVIKSIIEGASIERFLIVTFTVAAASEMRERIAVALSNQLSETPENKHLQKQSILVHKARICTIDSFCIDLVRTNFHILGLSPDFRIADDMEYSMVKQAICSEIVEEKYSEENEAFTNLANNFGSTKTDRAIEDAIYKIVNLQEAIPFADKWLEKMADFYTLDNALWLQEAIKSILGTLTQHKNAYNKLFIELAEYEELINKLSPILNEDLYFLEDVLSQLKMGKWDNCYEQINGYSFSRMPAIKGFSEHPTKQKASDIRNLLKKDLQSLKDGFFSMNSEDIKEDLEKLSPMVRELMDVVKKYTNRLSEEKEKQNFLTFSDISQKTVALLVDDFNEETGEMIKTKLARQIALQFDEIIIDEYQDTNEVQNLIFSAVSNNNENIFKVGDVKQSIYRFRNACPQIFINRKEIAFEDEKDGFPLLVNLSKNFRSRIEVLNYANFLFSQTMQSEFGEMDYNSKECLYLGASYPENKGYETEINILQYESSEETEDDEEEKTRDEKEAFFIANKIKELINSGFLIYDSEKSVQRRVEAGDFAILMRNLKNKGELYRKAIEDVGIAAFCEATSNFFEAYEINMVLSLLQVLDNPYIDIPLIAVMRSPIFSFTPDELANIRLYAKDGYYYNALLLAAKNKDEKCIRFLEKIKEYRHLSRDLPVYRLLMHIYMDTSLFSLVGGMERGFIRQENLNMLCRLAKNYEETSIKGLFSFVNYVNKIIEDDGDIGGAKPSPATDSVFITTIHKSKGLEFPVCIVAGCSVKFNTSDLYSPLLIHEDLGIGIKLRDTKILNDYTTLPRETIKSVLAREMLSEELRVLYVALTRAKEKLIIVTSEKNLERKLSNLSLRVGNEERLDPYMLMSCTCYSDWILATLLKHKDGLMLRELCGAKLNVFGEDFDLKINIIDNSTIKLAPLTTEATQENDVVDENIYSFIKERLDYSYPQQYLSKIPSKISVSELKGRRIDDEDSEKLIKIKESYQKPSFMQNNTVSSAELGTAIHKFFQYANFSIKYNADNIEEEIINLVQKGVITEAEKEKMNVPEIIAFFDSNLFERIKNSKKIVKEYRFTIAIPVKEYDFTVEDNKEELLLQGVIDLFFEEEDGIVLIDYKTDHIIGTNKEAKLIERYKTQLYYYAKAVEATFNKRVKQKYLYSLRLSKEIEIED